MMETIGPNIESGPLNANFAELKDDVGERAKKTGDSYTGTQRMLGNYPIIIKRANGFRSIAIHPSNTNGELAIAMSETDDAEDWNFSKAIRFREGEIYAMSNRQVLNTGNISNYFQETLLFSGGVSTGIVNLTGSLNDYPYLLIATGGVGTGDLRTALARGWSTRGFMVDTDFINVATSNGRFKAKVIANNQIEIIEASDNLRHIYGIKFPVGWMS